MIQLTVKAKGTLKHKDLAEDIEYTCQPQTVDIPETFEDLKQFPLDLVLQEFKHGYVIKVQGQMRAEEEATILKANGIDKSVKVKVDPKVLELAKRIEKITDPELRAKFEAILNA